MEKLPLYTVYIISSMDKVVGVVHPSDHRDYLGGAVRLPSQHLLTVEDKLQCIAWMLAAKVEQYCEQFGFTYETCDNEYYNVMHKYVPRISFQ